MVHWYVFELRKSYTTFGLGMEAVRKRILQGRFKHKENADVRAMQLMNLGLLVEVKQGR